MSKILSILFFLFFGIVSFACGQDFLQKLFDENYDSLYYDKLNNKLTTRLFLARKYSNFELNDFAAGQSLEYTSNPKPLLGIGATYNRLGFNLAIGLHNPDDTVFGSTRRFDLQTQINLRKLTIKLYTGRYQGYYLNNSFSLLQNWQQGKNYIRPDILSQTYGISGYYVFNSSHYSNKATFLQNEWQQKSAGSLLAGGTIFYYNISADSTLIPLLYKIDTVFRGEKFNKTGYFAMGGNIGYAYTFVLWKHWFFDLTLLGGFSSGFTKTSHFNDDGKTAFKLGFTVLTELGMGYNSDNFYAGLNTSVFRSNSALPISDTELSIDVGIVRFLVAYRFNIDADKNFLAKFMHKHS